MDFFISLFLLCGLKSTFTSFSFTHVSIFRLNSKTCISDCVCMCVCATVHKSLKTQISCYKIHFMCSSVLDRTAGTSNVCHDCE